MKRCPQCLFIYPESDSRCDFDNTPLVEVDEAEIEAATSQSPSRTKTSKRSPKSRKGRGKIVALTSVLVLALGLIAFFVYYRATHRAARKTQLASVTNAPAEPPAPIAQPAASVAPSSAETASPSPLPSPSPLGKQPATQRIATAHSSATVAPVSTSGPGMGKKLGGKPVILLTSGGKIDADEVWRTRDGVWYRRDGIVTLLKHGRVKAIVNQ